MCAITYSVERGTWRNIKAYIVYRVHILVICEKIIHSGESSKDTSQYISWRSFVICELTKLSDLIISAYISHSVLIAVMCLIYLSFVRVIYRDIIAFTVESIPNPVRCKICFCSEILNKCQLMHIWCVWEYILGLEWCVTRWRKKECTLKICKSVQL
jgi:hypothetical protein